eukprot:6492429-Amphidinium_carterae.4
MYPGSAKASCAADSVQLRPAATWKAICAKPVREGLFKVCHRPHAAAGGGVFLNNGCASGQLTDL